MKIVRTLLLAAFVALPVAAQACAVCGGSDDVKLVTAANTVLWSLLGLVAFIFVSTGSAIYFFWKKSHASGLTVPGDFAQHPQHAAD